MKDGSKTTRGGGSGRILLVTLGCLLCASAFANLVAVRRIQSLEDGAAGVGSQLGPLPIGTILPPFYGENASGAPATLSFQNAGPATVLYVFSPGCVWCARNLLNLKFVIGNRSAEFRFAAVSLEDTGLKQYLAANPLGIDIYRDPSAATRRAYKLGGTPETLVIAPGGKLVKIWMGAWTAAAGDDVASYFGLRLPGLVGISPAGPSVAFTLGGQE